MNEESYKCWLRYFPLETDTPEMRAKYVDVSRIGMRDGVNRVYVGNGIWEEGHRNPRKKVRGEPPTEDRP